jgi:hypothetical protein
MCQNLDLQLLPFIAFCQVFFPPLFCFFDLEFYCLFSFFYLAFLSLFVFPFLRSCFVAFFSHVFSPLAYPNLLGNKRLSCCCCMPCYATIKIKTDAHCFSFLAVTSNWLHPRLGYLATIFFCCVGSFFWKRASKTSIHMLLNW